MICNECKEDKDSSAFYVDRRSSRGYNGKCKQCIQAKGYAKLNSRTHHLKTKYGITIDEYDAMHDNQGGVCAICGLPETTTKGDGVVKRLAVDHCHTTGKVRGLLCNDCNRGIGLLKDDVALLTNSVLYLIGA